jgi:hypothetical protein
LDRSKVDIRTSLPKAKEVIDINVSITKVNTTALSVKVDIGLKKGK